MTAEAHDKYWLPDGNAGLPPLIPLETFFGNQDRVQGRISPDGARMSYLAPHNGVMNVWVRSFGRDDGRVVTDDRHRGIPLHLWAYDNRHILYRQDENGNENWHIFAVALDEGTIRDLTPFENIQADIIGVNPKFPGEVLIQLNLRNSQVKDVYRVNLATGVTTLICENAGSVVGWIPDDQFRIRGAYAARPDGGFDLMVRDDGAGEFRTLICWAPEDEGKPVGFTPNGSGIYIEDMRDADVSRLKVVDIRSGEQTVIASDPRVDIAGVMIHPVQRRVQAVSFNYDRVRWQVIDSDIAADMAAIAAVVDGDFSVLDRDLADEQWLLVVSSDTKPDWYGLYSRREQRVERLFSIRPELEKARCAPMRFVEIPARDGLTLPCFLTLPPGLPPSGLPLVLNVHGGPWHRDFWEFRIDVQWLANRGYAVLQVNFRGSTGFGKEFLQAGNREWGRNMQHDLTDAVRWAISQGIADPARVAVFGGSYGGYAALAGAAFTPDLYCCAVSMVGPSNILTWMAAIPPYWKPLIKLFHTRIGNPETDAEMLRARSPLFSVDQIRIPLLIGQGANDPRVTVEESNQIVAALREKGQEVDYALYADEGHGLARPENRIDFYRRVERFLGRHLGGRVET